MSQKHSRVRKFFSYYKPYLRLFSADMACAVIASAAMLAIPLCVRYITANLLQIDSTDALHQIYMMGGIMLGLIGLDVKTMLSKTKLFVGLAAVSPKVHPQQKVEKRSENQKQSMACIRKWQSTNENYFEI